VIVAVHRLGETIDVRGSSGSDTGTGRDVRPGGVVLSVGSGTDTDLGGGGACETMYYVGQDIGGTFTDVVLLDTESGDRWKTKVPTTPDRLHRGFRRGLERVCDIAGIDPGDVSAITHGSTVATNVVVEREGASLALITTEGFRDVLGIGETKRDELYTTRYRKPEPLIPRHRRYEVRERTTAEGEELVPVDRDAVSAIATDLDSEVECVVVFLLNAYANDAHEREIGRIVEAETDRPVICSHEILPVYREFGRLSTTVLNGYVTPAVYDYLDGMAAEIEEMDGTVTHPSVATASGGQVPIADAKRKPGLLVNSGPANGTVGAAFVADRIGVENLVTFDMGGTSCDVSLVKDGSPVVSTDTRIEGVPFHHPVVDIRTIAAGGGSIGWVDDVGMVHVGPRSAGADPGPACYDAGGEEPTLTDANLVAGRFNPDYFMGGEMELSEARAERAIEDRIADPLGLSVTEAAVGMLDIAVPKMADAIETMTIERGEDPTDYTLLSFGGAGPSHVGFLLDELPISRAVCAPYASVFSAFGLVVNPVKFDFQRTRTVTDPVGEIGTIAEMFAELERQGRRKLAATPKEFEQIRFEMRVDAKYRGQRWETEVPVRQTDLDEGDGGALVDRFHRRHEEIHTYKQLDEPVVVTNFRLRAVGETTSPALQTVGRTGRTLAAARKDRREVWFDGTPTETPIYDGSLLEASHGFAGPGVIEYVDTTIVVPPAVRVDVDGYGNVVMRGET